jgi:chemotaxis protein MotB
MFSTHPNSPTLLLVAIGIALTTGCVSSGKYDEAVAERDQLASEKELLAARLEEANTDIQILGYRVENQQVALQRVRNIYGELVNQLETEVAAGQIEVEMMKEGVNIRISEEILFESGAVDIDESGKQVVRRLADQLKATPYQIVVGGHTDNVPIGGGLAQVYRTNWDLAGARSAHVVDVLEASGIPVSQLLSVSFGETRPIASNDDPAGRAKNRRIEVRIRPIDVASETPDVAAPPPSR